MTDKTNLIVRSNIKQLAGNMSVSTDFAERLNQEVHAIIERAIKRAEENNRRTVMARDI